MHWYEWVFSGIGVAVIVYLIQWWVRSGKKEGASLTARQAKVIGSPVASGDNINQRVNAPFIQHADNVNIGDPVPARPAVLPDPVASEPAATRPRRPLPNMVTTGARVCRVAQIGHGVWTEHHPGYQDALAVQFTNEARRDSPNVGGLVKALIVYRRGEEEIRRITGCWLNQAADMTEFRVDETHTLLVGVMLGQQLTTVGKRRVRVDINADEIPTDMNALPNFHGVTASVRLTHADTGAVLYEGVFRLNENPLGIAEIHE
jgi:hypothetical protein